MVAGCELQWSAGSNVPDAEILTLWRELLRPTADEKYNVNVG
jgi:hypothetical protein